MSRTAEQRAADDALTAALDAARVAYFPEDAGRLLTDYVVVYACQGFDDDGDAETVSGTLVRDNSLPGYRAIGLLAEAHHHRLHGATYTDGP